MIGPTTNKEGTPFISFFLLKVEGILVVVKIFSLESFILILVKKALLIFEHGLESLLGFDSILFTLNFDLDLAFFSQLMLFFNPN